MNNISCNESYFVNEFSNNVSGKGDVFSKDVEKGSYLLELSGHYTCSAGGQQKHDVTWTIAVEGEKYEIITESRLHGIYQSAAPAEIRSVPLGRRSKRDIL